MTRTNSQAELSPQYRQIKLELSHWYDIHDQHVRQTSRDNYFAYGDRNTKYFHVKANFRRRRNHIDLLQNSLGIWCKIRDQLWSLLNDHFQHIASSSDPPWDQALLNLISPCITEDDNENLYKCLMFVKSEILWPKCLCGKHLGWTGSNWVSTNTVWILWSMMLCVLCNNFFEVISLTLALTLLFKH